MTTMIPGDSALILGGSRIFDIATLALLLPGDTASHVVDQRLVERSDAGLRLFRVNNVIARHLHRKSDEYLYTLSGAAKIAIGDAPPRLVRAGDLAFIERGTWHAVTEIVEAPFAVMAFEVPARDPSDVVFFDTKSSNFIPAYMD
jgi:quercetin dioxygenase-like cupin family protein